MLACWPFLAGGIPIGPSAAGLPVLDGRIAGISGITSATPESWGSGTGWKVAFLAGLLAGVPGLQGAHPTS